MMKSIIQTIIKNNLIHYYKRIIYGKKYKKIEFCYDKYDENNKTTTYYHNINNPAIIVYSNNKIIRLEYWIKGELHRQNLPAIIDIYDDHIEEKWYHHNEKLTDLEIESIKKTNERRKKMYNLFLKMKKD